MERNDVERAVIISILGGKLENFETRLKEGCFTVPAFRQLFRAAKECVTKLGALDKEIVFLNSSIPYDVYQELCSSSLPDNPEYLVQILNEEDRKKTLREILLRYTKSDLSSSELANKVISEIEDVMQVSKDELISIDAALELFESRWGKEREIKTGIYELDSKLKIRQGYLVTIGARPNIGKTGFALNIGYTCATNGIPVCFLSLEMSATELVSRLIARESGIDISDKEVLSQYELDIVKEGTRRLRHIPFFINDSSFLDINSLKGIIKMFARQHNFGVIIVDYIQLVSHVGVPGDTNAQRVSFITKSFKTLAKSLNIPIIILSQLRRGGGEEPELEFLKESGAIEEDSDVVLLLARDVGSDVIDIYVKKNRYGQAGYKVQATFLYGSKIV